MTGYHKQNRFYISDFDDPMEELILPLEIEIEKQSQQAQGYIDLWITSFGGYAHILETMVEQVETAKEHGIIVRTIVPSTAFSAGSMLAVTGTPGYRYIGKGGEHLIHYGKIASFEETPNQVDRYKKWKDRRFKAGIDHYRRYCEIPNLASEMLDDGWFIPAKDAIKWKLADHYMNKRELIIYPS